MWETNYQKAVSAFGDGDASNDSFGWDPSSLGYVRIMQIEDSSGNTSQDQLVYLPPPGGGLGPVPEASSFATWTLLLGAVVVGLSYRRQ